MAKLKSDSVSSLDFLEYLNGYSDFSFELSTLRLLRSRGLECEHAGVYEDPVTNKTREFDIRATKAFGRHRVRLAVECKNVRENFPVLISCVPRHYDESFHDIAMLSEPGQSPIQLVAGLNTSRSRTLRLDSLYSLYEAGEPVGKSTAQVGRATDGTITANDGEFHDKWGQCLSSASDLVARSYWDGRGEPRSLLCLSLVVPFVVVPDGRLWVVNYDSNGIRLSDPSPAERCSCFVNKTYRMGTKLAGSRISISHVEVVTSSGMEAFIDKYLITSERMNILFPKEGVKAAYLQAGNA